MENKLENALMEIYRRLYAHIGEDFDALVEKHKGTDYQFFMDYEIDQDDTDYIIRRVCIEKRIPKYYRDRLAGSVYLGLCPKFKK